MTGESALGQLLAATKQGTGLLGTAAFILVPADIPAFFDDFQLQAAFLAFIDFVQLHVMACCHLTVLSIGFACICRQFNLYPGLRKNKLFPGGDLVSSGAMLVLVPRQPPGYISIL